MKRPLHIDFEKLYQLASQAGEVDALENNLLCIYLLYRKSISFRRLLVHQKLSISEKLKMIGEFPGLQKSGLFLELIGYLLSQDLGGQIYYLNEGFSKVVTHHLNRVTVQLFTAETVSETAKEEARLSLEKHLDQKVVLKVSVEPSILGGSIIKLPNGKIFDFSYNKALSDIKYTLIGKG
jgi:ATP synthase F1 delta subunit